MSRIGKKLIPLPAGVKYKVEGNTVLVEGPKGKVSALVADGISLETKDGVLHVNRASEDKAAVHGLTRALVFNAVHGVTKGWTKERTQNSSIILILIKNFKVQRLVQGPVQGSMYHILMFCRNMMTSHTHTTQAQQTPHTPHMPQTL